MKATGKKTAKTNAKATTAPLVVEVVKKERKKNPPSTAFKKGVLNPHAFQPGNTASAGGKKHHRDALMSKALRVALQDRAPDEACKALGLPAHASWAQCLSRKLIYMALRGDLAAMIEIRMATEGARLHASLDLPDPDDVPPLISLQFIESDGAGRPAGVTVDAEE